MSHSGSTLQLVLDLSGTFVFGLNGALTAMEAENLDIVGVAVLAVITALGGGIIRDVLIGSLPPAAFRDWRYLAVGGGAGIAAFFARQLWLRLQRSITVFDAAGLALFCVTGTTTAFAAHLGPFQSIVLGTITGVGGGTVRDVVIRRVPTVLSSGLYAIPAACGATLTALALDLHFYSGAIAIVAAAICFTVRMAGVRFNLNVPVSHPRVTPKPTPSKEEP
ncbi:MAG: TRIC cation channel family protein [Actinomycetota bacterium]|nr:TRIC cation channel family protein [Actinomycetota bacterium]